MTEFNIGTIIDHNKVPTKKTFDYLLVDKLVDKLNFDRPLKICQICESVYKVNWPSQMFTLINALSVVIHISQRGKSVFEKHIHCCLMVTHANNKTKGTFVEA